jgi:hypothetical protein
MQKNNRITLKSYLDLHQLLQNHQGTHEENRAFALAQNRKLNPIGVLLNWSNKNRFRITEELNSGKYLHYLRLFTTLFSFFMLIVGFSTGFALLSYSGSEPVNVIYLLFVMVAFPLLSMSLSLLSMFTGNLGASFFAHFSPLYYVEKMVNFLPFAKKVHLEELPFSSGLTKWVFLQRVQLFSFLFSLGLFFALLFMIISKDIAFGWSTTLQVTPESFQSVLATLSLPWQTFLPSAVPSLELVELSHYFRLGEKLDANMIQNADKLGAWWKFLAMATLVYALVLRLLFWIIAYYGFERQLKKEFASLEGIPRLLNEFQTPHISTQAENEEEHLELPTESSIALDEGLKTEYHTILAWNFSENNLLLLQDYFQVNASKSYVVGGRNSFSEDQEIVTKLEGNLLIYVKAWEPPTMDFMDFLEDTMASKKVKKVEVCPVGTASTHYKSKQADVAVWLKKLNALSSEKLGVIDV